MCDDECSEAKKGDDQSNIREILQDCTGGRGVPVRSYNVCRKTCSCMYYMCIICVRTLMQLTHQQQTKMSRL